MSHHYVSTACQHLLCPVGGLDIKDSMCIASCKYCDAPCNCACHAGEKAPENRLYDTLVAAVNAALDKNMVNAEFVAGAVLEAMLAMPRTMPDRAADRLEAWLGSDRTDAEIFRQAGHLAVDLRVLINEFRCLREGGPK